MFKIFSWVGVLAFASASCGDETGPNLSNPNPGNDGSQPGAMGTPITILLGATNFGASAYQPSPLSVQPGTTVTWINRDTVSHTATSDMGLFDTGIIAPGQSRSWLVPASTPAAPITYRCMLHPSMRGALNVSADGTFATPRPSTNPFPAATPSPSIGPLPTPILPF